MATITYPYWQPVTGLKSAQEDGESINIVEDVKNFSQGHSWYKLSGGCKMKCYITFNRTRYSRNPGDDQDSRLVYAWFMQNWRISKQSRKNDLTEVEIDGWWNPRNRPYGVKHGKKEAPPPVFARDPIRLEEFAMMQDDGFKGEFRWVEDYNDYLLIAYQQHRIYQQSMAITQAAENAYWLMWKEYLLVQKWVTRYLGLKDLALIICRQYLDPTHFRCFENHHDGRPDYM